MEPLTYAAVVAAFLCIIAVKRVIPYIRSRRGMDALKDGLKGAIQEALPSSAHAVSCPAGTLPGAAPFPGGPSAGGSTAGGSREGFALFEALAFTRGEGESDSEFSERLSLHLARAASDINGRGSLSGASCVPLGGTLVVLLTYRV